MKGWKHESYRHSLASRGIRSSFLIKKVSVRGGGDVFMNVNSKKGDHKYNSGEDEYASLSKANTEYLGVVRPGVQKSVSQITEERMSQEEIAEYKRLRAEEEKLQKEKWDLESAERIQRAELREERIQSKIAEMESRYDTLTDQEKWDLNLMKKGMRFGFSEKTMMTRAKRITELEKRMTDPTISSREFDEASVEYEQFRKENDRDSFSRKSMSKIEDDHKANFDFINKNDLKVGSKIRLQDGVEAEITNIHPMYGWISVKDVGDYKPMRFWHEQPYWVTIDKIQDRDSFARKTNRRSMAYVATDLPLIGADAVGTAGAATVGLIPLVVGAGVIYGGLKYSKGKYNHFKNDMKDKSRE